tara:strand:- start:97 stop:681 length:585 start_codon:yes stop_codon:yes gene_type:complete
MNRSKKPENIAQFEPLLAHAFDIANRFMEMLERREKGDFTAGESPNDLVRVTENTLGYAVYVERRALESGKNGYDLIWKDGYLDVDYRVTKVSDTDMSHYIKLGMKKQPGFYRGVNGTGTVYNKFTGLYSHFVRYENVIAEFFCERKLYPLAEEFAKANGRLMTIEQEEMTHIESEEVTNVTNIKNARPSKKCN